MTAAGPTPVKRPLDILWLYWRKLLKTGSGSIPLKSEISISGLGSTLPNIVLSERLDDDNVIIRLAGTAVENITGQPLAGLNLLDLTPPTQRDRIRRVYANLFTVPCGFHISESIRVKDGKKYTLGALVLPLAAADGAARFTIGQYALSRNGFEDDEFKAISVIEHRQIDRFGYVDVGAGLPE
ncbi:PAS domain-containing protein [Kordiimonas aestuarii]|uniref:PAS domain-containing protein n=1 Tax=Kordiimonas aestuarii TaxID=1005925 RepID=UPI0021D1B305|nr:PAS domain-containing protein [Kordiimonas aestuarii]